MGEDIKRLFRDYRISGMNKLDYCRRLWKEHEKNPQWKEELERYISEYGIKKNILDVGCGFGHFVLLLQQRSNFVVGIDSNVEIVKFGKKKLSIKNILVSDGTSLPFKENSFEWVIANQVLEHITEPAKFLQEIQKILKLHGRLFLTTPNRFVYIRPRTPRIIILGLLGLYKIDPTHVKEYTSWGLKKLITENGFKIERFEIVEKLDFLPKFLARLLTSGFLVIAKKK
jgi:2-polyprenyl-3-methyl-5-hydroxy-6-metoxy-1,4-benzoquinol methylase